MKISCWNACRREREYEGSKICLEAWPLFPNDTKILELQEKLAERERIQHWRKDLIGSIFYQV